MDLIDDKLIYLDLDFISRKYEEMQGVDPKAKTTKTEGGLAAIGVCFLKVGVSTQESTTYSITSRKMLHCVWSRLNENYKNFEKFENHEGTKFVWVEGNLTLGKWSDENKWGYELSNFNKKKEKINFRLENSYFSAGFSKVFEISDALISNVGIPVRCLTRIMWRVDAAKSYVASPYIIIENNAPA